MYVLLSIFFWGGGVVVVVVVVIAVCLFLFLFWVLFFVGVFLVFLSLKNHYSPSPCGSGEVPILLSHHPQPSVGVWPKLAN